MENTNNDQPNFLEIHADLERAKEGILAEPQMLSIEVDCLHELAEKFDGAGRIVSSGTEGFYTSFRKSKNLAEFDCSE